MCSTSTEKKAGFLILNAKDEEVPPLSGSLFHTSVTAASKMLLVLVCGDIYWTGVDTVHSLLLQIV